MRGGIPRGKAALTRNGPGRPLGPAPRVPTGTILPVPRALYLPKPDPARLSSHAEPPSAFFRLGRRLLTLPPPPPPPALPGAGSRRRLSPARSDLVLAALLRRLFLSARHAHGSIKAPAPLSPSCPQCHRSIHPPEHTRALSPFETPVPGSALLTAPAPSPQRSLLGPAEWGRSLTTLSSPQAPRGVLLPRDLPCQ